MKIEAIHVRIVAQKTHWKLGVGAIMEGGEVVPYVGTTHDRTRREYSTVNDALVSARHLVNDILAEAPAGVPGRPVAPSKDWNTDGDVPCDKLTGGGR